MSILRVLSAGVSPEGRVPRIWPVTGMEVQSSSSSSSSTSTVSGCSLEEGASDCFAAGVRGTSLGARGVFSFSDDMLVSLLCVQGVKSSSSCSAHSSQSVIPKREPATLNTFGGFGLQLFFWPFVRPLLLFPVNASTTSSSLLSASDQFAHKSSARSSPVSPCIPLKCPLSTTISPVSRSISSA